MVNELEALNYHQAGESCEIPLTRNRGILRFVEVNVLPALTQQPNYHATMQTTDINLIHKEFCHARGEKVFNHLRRMDPTITRSKVEDAIRGCAVCTKAKLGRLFYWMG
eukprot:Filipodium_phascolosomae@DN595_c0_g1_i2.p1